MYPQSQEAAFGQEPPETQPQRSCWVSLLHVLARICCCTQLDDDFAPTPSSRQQLLEARAQQSHHVESYIETTTSPPRLPPSSERTTLLKGQAQSSQQEHPGADSSGQLLRQAASDKAEDWPPMKKGGSNVGSKLSLVDDDDLCPTCLEPYSEDNPRVTARCGHHYHLPCIYEWMERQPTCPMCGRDMVCEELL